MMSKNAMDGRGMESINPKVMDFESAKNSLVPMGYGTLFINTLYTLLYKRG